jgi:branched-chain amino acid transport system ATP-binding protein
MILAAVVLGGMSNMKGAMLGAAIIVFLPETFRGLEQSRFLVFGLILILMMIVRPAGLFPLQPKRYRLPSSSAISTFSRIAWWQKEEGDEVGSISTKNTVQVPAILRCEGLTKRFGGVLAIDQVSLTIPEGSIFAVIGPNGAGKSTLFNMISGSIKPDQGKVEFAGQSMVGLKPHRIAACGVARTFQLIRLFATATVAENVLIGADLRHAGSTIGTALGLPSSRNENRKTLALAEAALSFCGIRQLAGAIAGSLSYGDQRRTEIARALATSPRILLLDEPAAGMNPTERRRLGELIRNIRDSGITVVIVEHDMKLIMEISDEVLVLDSGRVLALGSPELVRGDPKVIEAYLGRQQDRTIEPGKFSGTVRAEQDAEKKQSSLRVRNLKVAYGLIEAVHHIDLDIESGEIVSLIGANGAGKTSTLLAISGVHRASGGTVVLNGEHIERWPAHRIAGAGVAHVPEGRRIFPRMTVWENLAMGGYATHMLPNDADLEHIFTLFPILRHRLGQQGGTLSGGEQQMLAMARALVSKPNLLLLDEPSMGLAPQLVQLIFGLIAEINRSGVSILLVEQNAEMALRVSDRAYVLEAGSVRLSGMASTLLDNKEIQAAYLGG